MQRFAITILSALLFPLLFHTPAFGLKQFLERARKLYDIDKPVSSCLLCHQYDEKKKEEPNKKNLNDYGHDVANDPLMRPLLDVEEHHKYTPKELETIDAVLKSLDDEDSDKDGATNREELDLGTFPGDKSSVPSAEALTKYRGKKK